jgi:DNA-binding SARP family transcriptional activator
MGPRWGSYDPGVAELRVRLLGGLEVDGLGAAALGSRKARALFAALACAQGAPRPVDGLIEVLWGDAPPAKASDQLAVLVSRLRGVVGTERITRTDAGLRLHVDWLDAADVEHHANAAAERLAAGDALGARLAAGMGIDLLRGPLLPEHDGDWVEGPRAAADRAAASLRVLAAEAALDAGDAFAAVGAAGAALDHDGYDERALRILMRAHVAVGRPASALAAYAAVRSRLAEDLGVSPTAETEALHDAVLLAPEPAPAPAARDRADPLVQRARTELAAMDFEAAWRDAERAVQRGGGAGAAEVAGWVAYYRRDFEAALAHARAGAASAREEERRASCLSLVGRVLHSAGDLAGAEAALEEAVRCPVGGVRGAAEVWLAVLRNHQGRPGDALALVEQGAVDEASLRHPFVLPVALFARTYALGLLGRTADALEVLDDWECTLEDLGPAGERYRPAFHNFSAWILQATGRPDEARAHSEAALVEGRTGDEPRNQALLDLAAAALDAGEPAIALERLGQLALAPGVDSTMAWHQVQRRDLLLARIALGEGDATRARELAGAVVADGRRRGAPRHALMAEVVLLLAEARGDPPVDRARVDAALSGLDELGVLEAWRATALLAAALDRDDLRAAAQARAARVAGGAGSRTAEVQAWIEVELARLA